MKDRKLKHQTGQTQALAAAALRAIARYTAANMAGPRDHMHEDIALRCARAADKGEW